MASSESSRPANITRSRLAAPPKYMHQGLVDCGWLKVQSQVLAAEMPCDLDRDRKQRVIVEMLEAGTLDDVVHYKGVQIAILQNELNQAVVALYTERLFARSSRR